MNYHELLGNILEWGENRDDRTGVGTKALFGLQFECDLTVGFPLLQSKKMNWNSIVAENLWFIKGSTNIKDLVGPTGRRVRIWDEWADEYGELGPIYGKQLRSWTYYDQKTDTVQDVDQLIQLVDGLRRSPMSRRHLVSLWHPGEVDRCGLPPCHVLSQFFVGKRGLSCNMYQRSADFFLGVPFNIAGYALLTHMLAHVLDLEVDKLKIMFGDAHVYTNHVDQCKKQLDHWYANSIYTPLPRLSIDGPDDILDLSFEHIHLEGYTAGPKLEAPIAV